MLPHIVWIHVSCNHLYFGFELINAVLHKTMIQRTSQQAIIGGQQLSDTVELYGVFSAHARFVSISPGEGAS